MYGGALGVGTLGTVQVGGHASYSNLFPQTVAALLSSFAKHLTDLGAVVGSTSALTTGQASTEGRVASLGDFGQIQALLGGVASFTQREGALLSAWQAQGTTGAALALLPVCVALERATGGLDAYLSANAIKAPSTYATAHNTCAKYSSGVGTISAANIDAAIVPAY